MTAPLPPPTITKIEFLDTPLGYERANVRYWNEGAVKLAVREALERVAQETIKAANEQKNWSLSAVLAAFSIRVRAMLKEYSDD